MRADPSLISLRVLLLPGRSLGRRGRRIVLVLALSALSGLSEVLDDVVRQLLLHLPFLCVLAEDVANVLGARVLDVLLQLVELLQGQELLLGLLGHVLLQGLLHRGEDQFGLFVGEELVVVVVLAELLRADKCVIIVEEGLARAFGLGAGLHETAGRGDLVELWLI